MSIQIDGVRLSDEAQAEAFRYTMINEFAVISNSLLCCIAGNLETKLEFAEKHFAYEYDLFSATGAKIELTKEQYIKQYTAEFEKMCCEIEAKILASKN